MSRDDKTPTDKTQADKTTAERTTADKRSADKPGDAVRHFPAAGRGKACPICGKPVRVEYRPFCSKRCADIDLGRWLGESYRIPAEEPPDDLDAENEPPASPEPPHRR